MSRFLLCFVLLLVPGILAQAGPFHAHDDPRVRACLDRVTAHPDSLELQLELIDAYRTLDTVESRRLAAGLCAGTLRKHPDDVPLLSIYGELRMDQGFFREAEGLFRRVARLDPRSSAGPFGMAQLALNDYRRYLDTKRLRIANSCLDQVLAVDPGHRDALFYRTFTHLVAGETTLARVSIARLVERHPDDAWGYLLLGAVAQGSRRYAEARQAMDRAAHLVKDASEKDAFETLRYVSYRAEEKRETLDADRADRLTVDFWKRIDPTPATGLNERRLEHLRRMVLAELFYGIPRKQIRGWNSAAGEAIVRFGPPISRSIGIGEMAMAGFSPPALNQVHEIDGEDVEFTFEDRNLSGLWLQPWNGGFPTWMDVSMSRHESVYRMPQDGPDLRIVAQMAQFRAGAGSTRLELVFATHDPGGPPGSLQRQVMIYDRSWDSLAYGAGWLDPPATVRDRRTPRSRWSVDLVALGVSAANDSVWIGAQIADTLTKGYGSRLEFVPVTRFSSTGLCVSDILLMDRIGFGAEGPGAEEARTGEADPIGGRVSPPGEAAVRGGAGPIGGRMGPPGEAAVRGGTDPIGGRVPRALSRPDGWGVPSPDRVYTSGENVPFYFEAYNLEPAADGLMHYSVSITIEAAGRPNPRMVRPALIDLKKPFRPRVATHFSESDRSGDLKRLLDLDVGRLPPGSYRLRLTLEDSVNRATAEASAVFRVIEPPVLSQRQR